MICIVALSARAVSGASIGLFSDSICSSCNLTIQPGGTATFYIRALTEGYPTHLGFTGAAFSISGLPAGWSTVSTPNPLATFGSDPFRPQGGGIGFPMHMPGTCIDLYTVTVTANSPASDVVLHVEGVASPWDPDRVCPLFFPGCPACDFDTCVDGGGMFINSGTECSVEVENKSWTRVKDLYR